MTPDSWGRVREIFDEVVALPEAERVSFLELTCGGDAGLRAEVERLLRADPDASRFFDAERRPDVSNLLDDAPRDLGPGVRLGRFALRRVIASGGMGTVWEAVQDRPHRTVAVKTLRHGFGAGERRQRFQLEAEVLGRLRHPGIAQIFEAGTHEDASGSFPYFAMELVEGARDIVSYADEQQLTRDERLRLFAEVCDAVHHGHQRGIVHRDLKPGNILVDAAGQPKIIDFGLARASQLEHTVTTAETVAGSILGTLPYMSPEQLGGDPDELDTRSDVYSLGVLLHQLVTGRPPHEVEGLPLQQTIALLRESEPAQPPGLPADLVWVIFRAIEKDRERRYASASELAADVRRFLEHEPVLAGPPSLLYRSRKLVRRHRFAFAALLLVLLSLSAGLAGVLWKQREARAERDVAIAINEFFDEMLRAPTPYASGRDVPMTRVLDAAAARIESAFPGRLDVQARIRASIGKAYQQLGRLDEAEPLLERALADSLRTLGEVDDDTAEVMHHYASVLLRTGRLEEAEEYYRRVVSIRAALHGPKHFTTSSARVSLSTALLRRKELDEAEELIRDLLELLPYDESREQLRVTVSVMNNLAGVLAERNLPEEALEQCERTIEYATEHLGEEDPYTAFALSSYANRLRVLGRFDEAEEAYLVAIELQRALLGPNPDLVVTLNNYGQFLNQHGRFREAEAVLREAYDHAEVHDSPFIDAARKGLVTALLRLDGAEEAVELVREDLTRADSAEERRLLADQLARLLEQLGRTDEARMLRDE